MRFLDFTSDVAKVLPISQTPIFRILHFMQTVYELGALQSM